MVDGAALALVLVTPVGLCLRLLGEVEVEVCRQACGARSARENAAPSSGAFGRDQHVIGDALARQLDLTPYEDEEEFALLKRMAVCR